MGQSQKDCIVANNTNKANEIVKIAKTEGVQLSFRGFSKDDAMCIVMYIVALLFSCFFATESLCTL